MLCRRWEGSKYSSNKLFPPVEAIAAWEKKSRGRKEGRVVEEQCGWRKETLAQCAVWLGQLAGPVN
jgi:hypothetical protein